MSLTTCIRKAGKNLNAEDKNAILEAARANRKAGMSADDAAKAAVRARLEAVQAELAAEQSQVSTWTPDQPKTLKERAEAMAATKPQRSLQEQVERPAAPDAVVASVGDPDAKGERKFYVTMVRGDRVARLAGPFDTKEEAEAMKPRAQDEANKADPRSAFDAFGVSAITSENHKPGTLNERLGIRASRPAPLYASRPLTPESAEAIRAWAASQGFKTTLPADDLHVTVAYSREPMDGAAMEPAADNITVTGGKRTVEPLGDEGAVVLKFTSPDMQARWKAYRDAGASWDYDSYTPHVTITYDGNGVDLSKVTPYTGPIELGPERQEPLNVDKANDYKTAGEVSTQIASDSANTDAQKAAASAPAPAEPDPLTLTPRQYHDATLRAMAESTGATLAEVREMYDTEAGRANNEQEWVRRVVEAAQAGTTLTRATLDKLLELRPTTRLPETAIPEGYQRPEARKAEAEAAEAKREDRRTLKQRADSMRRKPEGEKAAEAPATPSMPAIGSIPRDVAQRAHAGTSHVPEVRAGQEQESFRAALADAWTRAMRAAGSDKAAQARVREVFDDVQAGYRARYMRTLEARSRVMSSMITGPARFPVERNRKRMETERKRAEEASEYLSRGIKRMLRAARGPIDNSPESELESVRLRLAEREESQETMKAANVALRKGDDAALEDLGFTPEQIAELKKGDFAGRKGFADYKLTNNNAEIRRLRERLAEAQKRVEAAAAGPVEMERQGVRIVEDAQDDRLRLIFDGKPSDEVREDLKANGFKWSPKNEAWQRQLTDNAKYAAKKVLDKHFPADGPALPAMSRRMTLAQRAANFSAWGAGAAVIDREMAATRGFKTGERIVVEAYHGTARPDRVGTVFNPKRATSGPMAFFTSDPTLASSYAQGKEDTSIGQDYEGDYAEWFKVKLPGERSARNIDQAWWGLSPDERARIAALAPRVTSRENDDGNYDITLGPEGTKDGVGSYEYELSKTARNSFGGGNPLRALVESWLASGWLFNEEIDFLKVLRLAGFPMDKVEYASPREKYPFVYKTFIRMGNPLVTSDVPPTTMKALEDMAARDRSRAQIGGADSWDKNTITPREWVAKLKDPERSTYAWTSIPDKVTEVLRAQGYDGIVDWSGKGGGDIVAPVYIPFAPEQIKSALGNKGTYDPEKKDILMSRFLSSQGFVSPRTLRDEVAKIVANWDQDLADVEVVNRVEDLPADIQQAVRNVGSENTVRGLAMPDGRVYLVAENISTLDEGRFVLFHETYGHIGMRAFLGDGYDLQMRTLRQANPALAKEADAWFKLYGEDEIAARIKAGFAPLKARQMVNALAVEEALADRAGNAPELKGWKRLLAALQRGLRRLGLGSVADMLEGMTEAETLDLLVQARRTVQAGQRARAEAMAPAMSRRDNFTPRPDVATGTTDQGYPEYASSKVTLAFPQAAERFEVIPGDGQEVVSYAIMPPDSFDVLGHVELLVENGRPVSLLDIEVYRDKGRNKGVGRAVIEALLAANPDADLNISNIVPEARGFWESMGVPQQNVEGAYDGTLNWETYSANNRAAGRNAQGRRGTGEGRAAEGTGSRASASGQGEVGALFSRRTSQDTLRDVIPPAVQEWITDRTTSQRGFNRGWHRTVGTQLHKAKVNKEFGRAYYAVQDYMKDVSRMATLAADLAPDMLPQIESLGDLARLAPTLASPAAYKQRKADIKAASDALFDGTLRYTRDEDGKAVKVDPESDELGGLVWTDAELKARGMSDRAIKMYRQSRDAIGQSLDNMLAADLYRQISVMQPEMVASDPGDYAGLMTSLRRAASSDTPRAVIAQLQQAIRSRLDAIQTSLDGQPNQHTPGLMQRRQELRKLQEMIGEKVQRIDDLKDAGYAPLMRFGPYAVDVVNPDGRRVFFGMYESQAAANQAARKFQGDGLIVTQSVMPQKQFEALQGVSPETALLFAEMLGVEKNEAMQTWLKNAVAEQSALKRHIRRKGIEGFDDDGGRVLAAFVTSNARAASRALHSQRISEAVESISQGDVQDEARALAEYVSNPKEEAQAIRSLLFVQYIGGSIASAIVNLTQTVVQTFPFLSQYGGGIKAGQRIGAAMKIAAGGAIADKDLAAAVARAEKDGIIKPQEVFQLQAEASRNLGSNLYARSLLAAWGSMFQLAEVFNRRMAFIAAYKTAKEQGIADPFAFAENAVDETQSVFNKGNRPNWARGAVGSTIFTFKTFTIQYVEFLKRLATAGEPGSPERARGQKAAALALLALMLLAGMKGLPFAEDAEDLIDTVAQALGYNWTTDAQIDKWMDDTLGEALSDILQHGLSGVPGVPFDVSQRLGMQNLLPGTGLLKQSETNKQNQVLEVFGVAGSAVRDATQGQFLPIAIRNLMIGLDTYETGLYRDRRGRAVTEADPLDAALKAIGLQPNNVARSQRDIGRQIELRSLYQAVKEEITDAWAQAKFAGDAEGIEKARASLKRWNDTNPEARIIILPRTIDQRVIQMRRSKAERTIANAPRPLRASTAEALE